MTDPGFAELQARLRAFWPTVTLRLDRRRRADGRRRALDQLRRSRSPDPVFPAYEERFLCLVLSLPPCASRLARDLRDVPAHPFPRSRLLLRPVPELDTPEAGRASCRSRSWTAGTRRVAEAARAAGRPIADPRPDRQSELAAILPFCMTEDEGEAGRCARPSHLRQRPGPQPPGDEDGQPSDLRTGGCPATGRAGG